MSLKHPDVTLGPRHASLLEVVPLAKLIDVTYDGKRLAQACFVLDTEADIMLSHWAFAYLLYLRLRYVVWIKNCLNANALHQGIEHSLVLVIGLLLEVGKVSIPDRAV